MLDSAATRRVIAGSRIINGKRYAFEAEAVACVAGQDVVDTDPHVASAVLDRVQEMLHKSLAAFARDGDAGSSNHQLADVAKAEPGNQDYYGLIDYVIGDQRDMHLPGYLVDLAGNLERQVGYADKVRERLFFVVTGQMIEADLKDAE